MVAYNLSDEKMLDDAILRLTLMLHKALLEMEAVTDDATGYGVEKARETNLVSVQDNAGEIKRVLEP